MLLFCRVEKRNWTERAAKQLTLLCLVLFWEAVRSVPSDFNQIANCGYDPTLKRVIKLLLTATLWMKLEYKYPKKILERKFSMSNQSRHEEIVSNRTLLKYNTWNTNIAGCKRRKAVKSFSFVTNSYLIGISFEIQQLHFIWHLKACHKNL